jgi:hypothetical protein
VRIKGEPTKTASRRKMLEIEGDDTREEWRVRGGYGQAPAGVTLPWRGGGGGGEGSRKGVTLLEQHAKSSLEEDIGDGG